MVSLMNGLSALGQGVAGFAASAGLEQQKADLAQQQAILADRLATTRETTLQQGQQTFTSGENTANRAATAANLDTTNAAAMARTQAEQAGATARNTATINADSPEMKLLRALGVPLAGGATSAQSTSPLSGTQASPEPTGASGAATGAASGVSPQSDLTSTSLVAKHLGLPAPGSDDAVRRSIMAGVTSDPKFKDKPGDVQAAEFKKRFASASASLSSDALDTIADRTIAGDTSALTGLGYGEGGAANRASAQERITQKLKDQGLTGSDLAARIASFQGEKAGARTAGTREANVGMAVTEAQLFMPLALEASKLVPRTQFPTLNSIMLAAEQGTGGESVVRLAVATNSLVNAYSRAITPSGVPTEGNQTRARELLDKAWSDGQYAAAIDQLGKEMKAAKQSPIQQQAEQAARISGRPSPDAAATPPTGAAPAPSASASSQTTPSPGTQSAPSHPPLPPGFRVLQ